VGAGDDVARWLRVKFCGPVSGAHQRAELNRLLIQGLVDAGIPVEVEGVGNESSFPGLGGKEPAPRRTESHRIPYNVKILSLRPDQCLPWREPACINIGYAMFGADRLPQAWIDACNQLDGIFVPSRRCRQVFEASGVRVPVRAAPPGIDAEAFSADRRAADPRWLRRHARRVLPAWPPLLPLVRKWLRKPRLRMPRRPARRIDLRTAFKFYSIFPWSERANPRGLLEAYFAEFHRDTGVCLVLRACGRDFTGAGQGRIRAEIQAIQRSVRLPRLPPVLLMAGRLSAEDVCRLHASCDCFVFPHRGEGFGTAQLQAMAAGRPVITTGCSGIAEFAREDQALLLPSQLTPVFNMDESPCYTGEMLWAEPDLATLRGCMRRVFEDRALRQRIGRRAADLVRAQFNSRTRIAAMLCAIGEIVARRRDAPAAG
jgi:glycosyltransferase involved in cell wall biosynthesis